MYPPAGRVRWGWNRGGHGFEPKGGLKSRPLTNLPAPHRQLSQISPLSLIRLDLSAKFVQTHDLNCDRFYHILTNLND